jgi:hypothetical protein
MLKESIKSPIFTDGFRLIDLLCQSYPPYCVVLRLELSEWLWKKSHREQPIVRLAMCERSSLGLPHTENRMSGRPRVAEIAHEVPKDPESPWGPENKAEVCGVGLLTIFNCPKLR